ncbi:MAG: putative DNA-binding domain-containing protein [Burkholderiales bacterium]|nr:putative DNA-binding domain-containing protein [Burkholderiales bacterium]
MKTLELTDLQIAFHGHLLNQASRIAQEVIDGGRISVDHRLNIYHNAYRVRLLENLRDAYEKTWTYLGDDTFDASALAFIEANPPQHRNLRWHGAEFPQFLANQFPRDTDIAELALIDWQLRHAFDGPNATPVQPAELAGLSPEDWENVGFQFAPTLFIAPLRYNTVSIWHALDQEQVPPTAEALPEPSWLLIWRKGWQPHFRTIQAVEQAALAQMQGGASFAEVCAALSQQFSDQEAATVAAEGLRTWLQDELIVGLTGLLPR